MKHKNLTKEQIIISIDRLTRFKKTRDKYLRVFTDIITSNLIEPKLRKSDIERMDLAEVTAIATEIFNSSLETSLEDLSINEILKDYENSVFVNDEDCQKLLNNKINYKGALDLIKEDAPVNLKWLKSLGVKSEKKFFQARQELLLKFPIEKVILVEGITEDILLPVFSKLLGYDFYAHGIQIIPAGGKNQVVKLYYELLEDLKIPIFILLDKDAEDNINQITPRLRNIDRIHLVSCGEFEDLLPKSLLVKTVNSHFKNFLTITEADLLQDESMVNVLEEIFKTKGLHEFKKAEFAKLVKENVFSQDDISPEIIEIIEEIKSTNKSLDSKICS